MVKNTGIATHVVGSDGPSRIARDKLDLHINLGINILIVGLEGRARAFVEGEGKKASTLFYIAIILSPCYGEVIEEVVGKGSCQKAKQ